MGGMINFVMEDDRTGFEINRYNSHPVNIELSFKLLRVAVRVMEE